VATGSILYSHTHEPLDPELFTHATITVYKYKKQPCVSYFHSFRSLCSAMSFTSSNTSIWLAINLQSLRKSALSNSEVRYNSVIQISNLQSISTNHFQCVEQKLLTKGSVASTIPATMSRAFSLTISASEMPFRRTKLRSFNKEISL